ncbi:hypothetical protein A6U86_27060 [Rhizobium sp. AC27/96]|nr:hypothetical protein A6U86_27060 [Rhizobium sp. AC27/96]
MDIELLDFLILTLTSIISSFVLAFIFGVILWGPAKFRRKQRKPSISLQNQPRLCSARAKDDCS